MSLDEKGGKSTFHPVLTVVLYVVELDTKKNSISFTHLY